MTYFPLNYIDRVIPSSLYIFLSMLQQQIAKFFFCFCLFLFCLVKVYCHADAAMKTVWKAWNGLLLTVNLPDFLQAVFGNFLLYSCLHTYKSII